MGTYISLIKKTGLMPALTVNDKDKSRKLAETFLEAGQNVLEVTMRTSDAEKSVSLMKETGLSVGAGSVIDTETAKRAFDAGADFLVCPGLFPSVIEFAENHNLEIIPGVATPTEIGMALSMGFSVLKLFPADLLGGVKFLRAMKGPFPKAEFIPMGGVTTENARDYLVCENVVALGGPWMAKKEVIDSGDFDKIRKDTEKIKEIIKYFRN